MSQTPACPDVPDDVRALARSIATSAADRQFSSQWYALRRAATDAILADRASRALPSTALAARPEEGCQIKPLEWRNCDGDWYAYTKTGNYSVERTVCAGIEAIFAMREGRPVSNPCTSREVAKAVAQRDHEARIRSAFAAPSTPPTAGDGHD